MALPLKTFFHRRGTHYRLKAISISVVIFCQKPPHLLDTGPASAITGEPVEATRLMETLGRSTSSLAKAR
ncbi:hypothetical protein O9993_17465 [Vibrio lentus]|nr:hypothetical protein [Vibrio lentus]